MKKFYITTTLPYVNAEPHIGFALEIVQADAIARSKQEAGYEVVFNFGTDEHGKKIYEKAVNEGRDPKEYCDEYAAKFDGLKKALNLSYNKFIRTTDAKHIKAAQEFWNRCLANGDIYKKKYAIKYCVGCELEKTDSELIDGKCPLHPNNNLEIYEEDNYFFRFSKYQERLLRFYEENPVFVFPDSRFNEIKAFVKSGLSDFSVSRIKEKMPWGIDVPNDPEQVMYVWFDALINYISTLDWPNGQPFTEFWPGVQVAGKDNLRQQTAMWQAMLMSAGVANSKQVFIHGFMTLNGQKISKSLGNTINPLEMVEKYGTDAVRYYLLAKLHPWDDSDFTFEKFETAYNADLANGLGNLVSRVAKLCEKIKFQITSDGTVKNKINQSIENYRFDEALWQIWNEIAEVDKEIEQDRPWKLEGADLAVKLLTYTINIRKIATQLKPFLPETADKILKQFPVNEPIVFSTPLFPRIK